MAFLEGVIPWTGASSERRDQADIATMEGSTQQERTELSERLRRAITDVTSGLSGVQSSFPHAPNRVYQSLIDGQKFQIIAPVSNPLEPIKVTFSPSFRISATHAIDGLTRISMFDGQPPIAQFIPNDTKVLPFGVDLPISELDIIVEKIKTGDFNLVSAVEAPSALDSVRAA